MKKNNKVIQEVQVGKEQLSTREQQQKKSLTEKYQNVKSLLYKCIAVIVIIYLIITIPICILNAYDKNISQFGDGPVNYAEDAYNVITVSLEGGTLKKETIQNFLGESKAQRIFEENAEKDTEENAEEINIKPSLTENIGLDIKRSRQFVTDLELYTQGEYTILKYWITKGSFKAEIITKVDENYHVVTSERNYYNKEEYMQTFYETLRKNLIFDGLKVWSEIALLPCILLTIIIIIINSFLKKSVHKKEIDSEKQEGINLQRGIKEDTFSKENPTTNSESTSEISA